MITHQARPRPARWEEVRVAARHGWLLPLLAFDWCWQWLAYLLAHWSFLEVLEYLGSFSVLIGVIFWFSESGARIQQKHYQAWQVINTAQGKGGSGGRIEALESLNADHISLVGVDVSSAFLQGVELRRARLARASFGAADLRDSNFETADLSWADFHSANLRGSRLHGAVLDHANLSDCDLFGADLAGARLEDVDLTGADLRHADLNGMEWGQIAAIRGTNLAGVRNPPPGFLAWAMKSGAVQKPEEP